MSGSANNAKVTANISNTSNAASEMSSIPAGPTPKLTMKEKWRKLKEEDKRRKEKNIVYVSDQDATKITGYGKDGGPKTRDEEQNGYKKTGVGKLMFGILALGKGM